MILLLRLLTQFGSLFRAAFKYAASVYGFMLKNQSIFDKVRWDDGTTI